MKTIWKFPLPPLPTDLVELDMPTDADILTLQLQGRTPTLWAVVDDKAEFVTRHFVIVGTGHEIPEEVGDATDSYVGTWQFEVFVWHLFDLGEGEV